MRKITREASEAFFNRNSFRKSNTEVRVGDGMTILSLWGNDIARINQSGDVFEISNGGWDSRTTKERLNGLRGVSINQKNYTWYLNGKEWDGRWVSVNDSNDANDANDANDSNELTKHDIFKIIEDNMIHCDISYRGGSFKIDVSEYFDTGEEEAIMGAYQNYLGGGIAGSVRVGRGFDKDALPEEQQELYEKFARACIEWFYLQNNGGGDDYMQENVNSMDFKE